VSGAPANGAPESRAGGFGLALKIAYELHAPTPRAPEVAGPLAVPAVPCTVRGRAASRHRAVRG